MRGPAATTIGWACLAAWGPACCLAPIPHELSPDNDLFNQHIIVEYFSGVYYKSPFAGVLPDEPRKELRQFAAVARENPVLALAAAQALYMFGWYTGISAPDAGGADAANSTQADTSSAAEGCSAAVGGIPCRGDFLMLASRPRAVDGLPPPEGVDWENVEAAAELFETSLDFAGCRRSGLTMKEFVEGRSCDTRWSHALGLAAFLAAAQRRVLRAPARARALEARAASLLRGLGATARFGGGCCGRWAQPLDFNFNAVFFPGVPSAPVWSRHPELRKHRLPLVRFLEEHTREFQSELSRLWEIPREAWHHQSPGSVNAEHLASPGGWHMLAIVRHGVWNQLLCQLAPRTCELLGSRPEIVNCTVSNSNVMRLSPGGMVKPHFGNAPRLSVHLALATPEPQAAAMLVGDSVVHWREGEVLLFDDTYIHSVVHRGRLPRYVLNVWFCHPCDTNPVHQHGQSCIV